MGQQGALDEETDTSNDDRPASQGPPAVSLALHRSAPPDVQ